MYRLSVPGVVGVSAPSIKVDRSAPDPAPSKGPLLPQLFLSLESTPVNEEQGPTTFHASHSPFRSISTRINSSFSGHPYVEGHCCLKQTNEGFESRSHSCATDHSEWKVIFLCIVDGSVVYHLGIGALTDRLCKCLGGFIQRGRRRHNSP